MNKKAEKLALIFFIGLVIVGLSEIEMIKRLSYMTTFTVWYIWWPMLMVIALISIRLWCMICPLRTISSIYSKYSLGLSVPKKFEEYRLVFMAFLFLVIHSVVLSSGMMQFSIITAIYLLVLIQYSAVMSLVFQKDSYCRVFCPIGVIVEVFSKLGVVRFESCLKCDSCSWSCINNNYTYSFRNPLKDKPKIDDVGGYTAIVILFGVMLHELSEKLEVMAVSYGNWSLWLEKAIGYVPKQLNLLGSTFGLRIVLIAWEYVIFPLLIIMAVSVILRMVFFRRSFRFHLDNLASSMVPLIFSVFLVILIDLPLTTFYPVPPMIRKSLLLFLLLMGLLAACYVFFHNLISSESRQGDGSSVSLLSATMKRLKSFQ